MPVPSHPVDPNLFEKHKDTVIFLDSSWNPQQDLQVNRRVTFYPTPMLADIGIVIKAMDRAHRIGQTKPVLVFRLVTANTIESKMLQRAGSKRKLEALVMPEGSC